MVRAGQEASDAPSRTDLFAQKLHALVDVQCGAHAFERQAELHQRDRDGGLHAYDHRLRIEHARHRRDVADHAADERVDDFEARDVDEHSVRPVRDDAVGEIVLQLHGELVVHVDLDGHEQEASHAQNRNLFHDGALYAFGVGSDTVALILRNASVKASARVAFVVTADRSTPRCTMVCAICGRMPLMMQSAPMSRAAATVFNKCCATSVSTVGTPVMSMMASPAPMRTMACSRLSITTWVRALSSVPMSGRARMPSH